jgi:hypothetical protein
MLCFNGGIELKGRYLYRERYTGWLAGSADRKLCEQVCVSVS